MRLGRGGRLALYRGGKFIPEDVYTLNVSKECQCIRDWCHNLHPLSIACSPPRPRRPRRPWCSSHQYKTLAAFFLCSLFPPFESFVDLRSATANARSLFFIFRFCCLPVRCPRLCSFCGRNLTGLASPSTAIAATLATPCFFRVPPSGAAHPPCGSTSILELFSVVPMLVFAWVAVLCFRSGTMHRFPPSLE